MGEIKVRKPAWLKTKVPLGKSYLEVRDIVDKNKLHTICTSGHCPNIAECWGRGTATLMILGDICTRACKFCNVKTRRPIPIDGSNFTLNTDLVIVAVGTGPNPIIFQSTPDLKRNKWGYIDANPETNETSKEFVYAGGDIVTGSATVIEAMGAGRIAARGMHKKLTALRNKKKKKAKAPTKA